MDKNIYILTVSCVNDDDLQMAIHDRADIVPWLKKVDHEGANWSVCYHKYDELGNWLETEDLTNETRREYEGVGE